MNVHARRLKRPTLYGLPVVLLVAVALAPAKCQAQDESVPSQYRRFFSHYRDTRSIPERALNIVGLSAQDVGRSFALIAGVSHYPNFRPPLDPSLGAAGVDITKLERYLKTQEFFDEIVVLRDSDMNYQNLMYFLQVYFPQRVKRFPRSRFLFAYSGHGTTDGKTSYLVVRFIKS